MKVKNLLLAVLAFGAANILMACNTDRPSDSSPSVPTHTHSWNSDWEHDDSNHWHICTDSECEEIDSKGAHAWDEGTVTKAATCEEAGVMTYKCTVCELTKTEAINPTGHTYGELVEAVEATCEEAGHAAYYHCSDCDTYFTEGKEKTTLAALTEAAKGHDYVHQSYTKIDGVWYSHQVCIGDSEHSQNVVTDMIKVEVNGVGYEKLSEAVAAAASGAELVLVGNVEETTAIVVTKDLTINLNGKTIIIPTDTVGDGVFRVTSGTLTINGEGTINGVGNNDYNMAIWVNGGKVVINGGTYTNAGATANVDPEHFDLIYVRTGELIINGGTFIDQTPQWTINVHDTEGGKVTVNGGTFYKYNPAESLTENPVANFVGEGYQSVAHGDNYVVNKKEMVAGFTFENGLANSVENSKVIGYLFSNATDTRGQVVDIDPATRISTTHTVGSTSYDLGSNAMLSAHSSANPSFGASGFDMGSGDFTISMKHYMPSDFIKANYSSKNNQWCVMSVNSEANSTNKLFIYLGKDSASAGFFRPIVNLNGTKVNLYTSNVSGYYSGRKWAEYRVVKQGTKVTVTIIPSSAETNAKCIAYSVEFTLESADDFTLTPEQVIGFGNNYGSTRPGNDSYYDDIKVWNYAVDFE